MAVHGSSRAALPLFDFLRLCERSAGRLRSIWLRLVLRSLGAHVGRRLSVARGVRVTTGRGAAWHLGDRVSLGNGVVLSVGRQASLILGDDVKIMDYTIVGTEESILIENRAQIAEHCTIRDHDHDTSAASMHNATLVCAPIRIGQDAWIGRGVAVLRGSDVGEGTVVGANAVVRGEIPSNTIAAGIPARVLRMRR